MPQRTFFILTVLRFHVVYFIVAEKQKKGKRKSRQAAAFFVGQ
jgi:hypothetical protein